MKIFWHSKMMIRNQARTDEDLGGETNNALLTGSVLNGEGRMSSCLGQQEKTLYMTLEFRLVMQI